MFEVGFTEILLIMVIALVVLGPERLPKLAADVGRWMGRARSMARQLRSQLDQEVQLEEMLREKPRSAPAGTSNYAAGAATGGAAAATTAAATDVPPPFAPPVAPEPEIGAPTDEPHSHGSDFAGHAAEPPQPDYGLEAWHDPSHANGALANTDAPSALPAGVAAMPPSAPVTATAGAEPQPPASPAAGAASADVR